MLAAARAIGAPARDEDLFAYAARNGGDRGLRARILGAANEFKEGDEIVGVAAATEESRRHARMLLAATTLATIDAAPLLSDDLYRFLAESIDPVARARTAGWTLGELKRFLLAADESAIQEITPGLSSDAIGCVVKLMSCDELTRIGRKVFHPLPGSRIGARGYLSARVQPNSPTDHTDDIAWQVLDAWSYGVGDLLLGTNPVSSEPASVSAVELVLRDLLRAFGVDSLMPHCVLSHIDVQAEVEREIPGSTELWFQSIAGSDAANATFGIGVEGMRRHAASRAGRFGMYFETGQGADFTNGHSHGLDMVLLESRKYGFARALGGVIAGARRAAGRDPAPWMHVNDVAGFIGPEVFRTREQLVRCCLEDIVMGKLHGLCIGLDVCTTLHMDVSLDDLDWCLDRIVPACPAYLMALPTKIDPMLGYLTTSFHDHVRLREKFGLRADDAVWAFFQSLGVIDAAGGPGEHFGDPLWLRLELQRRRGDDRPADRILDEARRSLAEVRARGVLVAQGHGDRPCDPPPGLLATVRGVYDDAKQSIWAELEDGFVAGLPGAVLLRTRSLDRRDYICHPASGERLDEGSEGMLAALRAQRAGSVDAQLVVSDGLNALAVTEPGQLAGLLEPLRDALGAAGWRVADELLVVRLGRVRAGYEIGSALFGGLPGPRALLHVVGERPGSGRRTLSVYVTCAEGDAWRRGVDHDITRVVSGVAMTALAPRDGAAAAARLLAQASGRGQ